MKKCEEKYCYQQMEAILNAWQLIFVEADDVFSYYKYCITSQKAP
jgi:hypothetical protein